MAYSHHGIIQHESNMLPATSLHRNFKKRIHIQIFGLNKNLKNNSFAICLDETINCLHSSFTPLLNNKFNLDLFDDIQGHVQMSEKIGIVCIKAATNNNQLWISCIRLNKVLCLSTV